MGVSGQHIPQLLYPWEISGTHYIGGWVVLRAGLDRCRKFCPPHQDSIPRPSGPQRVAVLEVTKSNGDEGSVVDSAFQ
jgi:hypothetical protein